MTVLRGVRNDRFIIFMIYKKNYLLGLAVSLLLEADNDQVVTVGYNPPPRTLYASLQHAIHIHFLLCAQSYAMSAGRLVSLSDNLSSFNVP